jgi:hypothetical protein
MVEADPPLRTYPKMGDDLGQDVVELDLHPSLHVALEEGSESRTGGEQGHDDGDRRRQQEASAKGAADHREVCKMSAAERIRG